MLRRTALLVLMLSPWPAQAFDHDYKNYGDLLESIVVPRGPQTRVDYQRLGDRRSEMNRLAREFSAVSRAEYNNWTSDQRLAFLINAYNLFTLQLVSRHYPEIDSIKEIGGFFKSPWKIRFFSLLGEETHLDHVEHVLIRENFVEPRIHFAVVCASISCPPLLTEPYQGNQLDEQLEHATRRFLSDPGRNRYLPDLNRLELSPLFKWYREDFTAVADSIQAFVRPYMLGESGEWPKGQPSIRYLNYDWSLNDVSSRPTS